MAINVVPATREEKTDWLLSPAETAGTICAIAGAICALMLWNGDVSVTLVAWVAVGALLIAAGFSGYGLWRIRQAAMGRL